MNPLASLGHVFTWVPCCTSGSRVGPLWGPWAQCAGDSGSLGPPHVSPLGCLTLASLFLASKAPAPISSGALSLQRTETFPQSVRASAFSSVHPLPTPGKEKSSHVCVCVCVCVCVVHTAQHPNTLSCHPDAEAESELSPLPLELRPSHGSALPTDPQNSRTGQLSPVLRSHDLLELSFCSHLLNPDLLPSLS